MDSQSPKAENKNKPNSPRSSSRKFWMVIFGYYFVLLLLEVGIIMSGGLTDSSTGKLYGSLIFIIPLLLSAICLGMAIYLPSNNSDEGLRTGFAVACIAVPIAVVVTGVGGCFLFIL